MVWNDESPTGGAMDQETGVKGAFLVRITSG
jgi:hypothetical protein